MIYIFMHIQMTETEKDIFIIEKEKGNTPPLRIFIIKKIIKI